MDRPADGAWPRTAFLMENLDLLNVNYYQGTTEDQDSNKVMFDLYNGCQNVHINHLHLDIKNQTKAESAWIRNDLDSRSTKNVKIDYARIIYEGSDEALAIFNFNTGGSAPVVEDVAIDTLHITTSGSGKGASYINNYPGQDLVRNVSINNLKIDMTCGGASPFGFKFSECGGYVGELEINCDILAAASGTVILLRGIAPSIDTPHVGVARIHLESDASSAIIYGQANDIVIDDLTITSSANFTIVVTANSKEIKKCDLTATYDNQSVNACYSIKGNVHGKMQGVEHFDGVQYCDTDAFNADTWFLHSAATTIPAIDVIYKGAAVVFGVGTVTRIVSTNATKANDTPVYVDYTLQNLSDLTVGTDFFAGTYPLVEYSNVEVKSTGTTRRTKTLDV